MSNKLFLLSSLFLTSALTGFGQAGTIVIPKFGDKYSDYVRKLENGQTDIDYTDFRDSFLESKQFGKKGTAYDSLKKLVRMAASNRNYNEVISLTKGMLSIDYTSMFAHKYLQQTYKILDDTINRNKYHDIEFGLLNSIIHSGDGKTCETGWHVTQIEEEYFILSVVGATLQKQSISNGGGKLCDKMEVKKEEGETKTYYFEANKVFEIERKMLGEK